MRKARSGGQRTNLRRRYTTRSWLIPSSHVRVNACGGVLVLTQRITARAIQKFTHCALNTNPISKFPILPPLPLAHLRWKNCYLLSLFVSSFEEKCRSCCIQATLVSKNFDRIWDIFATCSICYETLVGFFEFAKVFRQFRLFASFPEVSFIFWFLPVLLDRVLNSIQNFVSFFWKKSSILKNFVRELTHCLARYLVPFVYLFLPLIFSKILCKVI